MTEFIMARFKQAVITILLLIFIPLKSYAEDYVVAFIYHISRSTEFAIKSNEVELCVIGDETKYEHFKHLDVGNHDFVLKVNFKGSEEYLDHCNIVYLPRGFSEDRKKILSNLNNKPILTIGHDDFAWAGGMISIYLVSNKLVFDINYKVLQSSKIKVDVRILELGRVINK